MTNHSDQIPNDLALEILAKLPVKSLKRFSCVRKSWLNLLENPDFKSMYYENLKSKTAHSSSLLLWRSFYHRDKNVPSDNNVHLLSGERYENMVTLALPTLVESYDPGEVLECVNGIICHYERGSEVIGLWNPKTDERKIIPPGINDDEPGFDRHVSVHGFGYDNVNDDYKVIQCVYYNYSQMLFEEPVLRIWQIYSLKINYWKKLDLEMTMKENVDKASIAYLNGVCHWWGSEFATNGLEEQVLVSFNLSTETFRTTSIVWVQENDDSSTRTLVVLNESVTLISSFAQNNFIEISILGEVGVKESWVKLFTLGPFPSEWLYPLRMGNKCDVIFYIRDDSNELASFDVITGKLLLYSNVDAIKESIENLLKTMYAKVSDLASARSIFDLIIKKSIFSWTSMIAGYPHSYHPLEALHLFRRLVRTDFRPDGLIPATVLSACIDLGSISVAQEMEDYILQVWKHQESQRSI
ncbi:putative F-box protein At3g16210 [Arachis stenosperma]|uniref:putative F-box protein At3g16210 n=1 Tax=Arachis stenosperma TaxID=217475 RepID=UPI0025AD2A35|nr:putative F-box protein At3g16210 [Arachis stenosperma]